MAPKEKQSESDPLARFRVVRIREARTILVSVADGADLTVEQVILPAEYEVRCRECDLPVTGGLFPWAMHVPRSEAAHTAAQLHDGLAHHLCEEAKRANEQDVTKQ